MGTIRHHHRQWPRRSSTQFTFKTEVPDESDRRRYIDLGPAPSGVAIIIEGRRYTDFDILFPIECKRLPTPKRKVRDEREYVITHHATTGGVQRFKAGHHGSVHEFAAMIAYVQEGTLPFWEKRIGKWIKDLATAGEPAWTVDDLLRRESRDKTQGIAILRSSHTRENDLPKIELRHLRLKMY